MRFEVFSLESAKHKILFKVNVTREFFYDLLISKISLHLLPSLNAPDPEHTCRRKQFVMKIKIVSWVYCLSKVTIYYVSINRRLIKIHPRVDFLFSVQFFWLLPLPSLV